MSTNPLYSGLQQVAASLLSSFGVDVVITSEQPNRTRTRMAGYFTEMEESDAALYTELGLVQTEAPYVLWVPKVYGQMPSPGNTVTWAGKPWTIKAVKRYRPDNTAIYAYLILVVA